MSKTPQQVIKDFMAALDTHTFNIDDSDLSNLTTNTEKYKAVSLKMLNQAVTKSSKFESMQDLIDNFIADCKQCNEEDSVDGWNKFLSEKCGIKIETGESYYYQYTIGDQLIKIDADKRDNGDTGAISGSDANIVTKTGETVGSGVEKNRHSVVPEYGNYYEAATENRAQNINTGSNGWIVKATANNDTIVSGGEDSINAGAGSNSITVKGSSVTIDSGAGNDKIYIDSTVKNVTLLNFGEGDETSGGVNATIFTVSADSETDTAQDNTANENTVMIPELVASYDLGDLPGDSTKPVGKKPGTRKGGDEDVAPNADSTVLDGFNNKFNTDGVLILSDSGDKINVNLDDAITPSSPVPVGGFTVKNSLTNANFVSTNSEAQSGKLVGTVGSVYPEVMSFKFKGLTLNIKDRRLRDSNGNTLKTLKTFSDFDDVGTDGTVNSYTYNNSDYSYSDTGNKYEKYAVASIYKWWMKEGLALNQTDYDYSFEDDDAKLMDGYGKFYPCTINLHFDKTHGGSNALAAVWHSSYTNGKIASLDLTINKDYYYKLTNYNDVDGEGNIYLDRTIAHELTHAIMAAKIDYFAKLPKFIKEGMAELTHGIDDKRTGSILRLAKNYDSLLERTINLENEYTEGDYSYAGGYMLLRYLAKQEALRDSSIQLNPEDITATVNLSNDGIYYVSGTLLNETVDAAGSSGISLGSAENKTYTVGDKGVKQIINIPDPVANSTDGWYVKNNYDYMTINGGTGNDRISLTSAAKNNVIQYASGDGNDIVYGFDANDTFEVTGAKYSTVKSGSDLIVGVGTDSITLEGAASIAVNINGTLESSSGGPGSSGSSGGSGGSGGDDGADSSEENKWTISGTTAKYGTSKKTLITVSGLKSGTNTSNLSLSGTTVTLKAAALGTSKVTISGNYSLALANDVTKSKTTAAGFTVSGTTATYKSKETTEGYILADDKKSVTYSKASGGENLFTVSGLKKNTDAGNLTLKDKTVTLKAAALGTGKITISKDYTLALANDVTKSKTTAAGFTVSGTTATYKSKKTTEGYILADDKKSISYTKTSGGETLFTVSGLKKNTDAGNLTLKDKTVTLKAAALGTGKITISKGYTLALASDVTKSKTTAAGFTVNGTTATYKSKKIIAGYTLADDKKSVTYSRASGGETLVTLSGLKSGASAKKLSLSGNTVNINSSIIGNKGASVNGGGYTFKLSGAGKLTNFGAAATFKGSSGKDILIGGTGKDTIYGNAGADYLSGGKGNDSIFGGAGNDTLIGGAGKDVFVYAKGDGKDVITDYTAGRDKIKISSGSISKTTVSGKDVIFSVGSGSITVKNGKGKKITVVDSKGKTSTKTYTKNSAANRAELWFTADDTNFSTSSAQIDSITKNGLSDYSLGNVNTTMNWTNLTPSDSLTSGLTFSEK